MMWSNRKDLLTMKVNGHLQTVSKLIGHAKEIITIDVYGDNQGIIADCVPEIADFMEEVMPGTETDDEFKEELLDIVIDTGEYLDEVS